MGNRRLGVKFLRILGESDSISRATALSGGTDFYNKVSNRIPREPFIKIHVSVS